MGIHSGPRTVLYYPFVSRLEFKKVLAGAWHIGGWHNSCRPETIARNGTKGPIAIAATPQFFS